ncbi:hypothetical protein AURDEDRAFT_111568 [Auricularia subglabra TFB-10046 SS5]|nr:hypothetical protein AURDEDRAFT_111568 [Auricularia subglabra TFB-10046 SS5]
MASGSRIRLRPPGSASASLPKIVLRKQRGSVQDDSGQETGDDDDPMDEDGDETGTEPPPDLDQDQDDDDQQASEPEPEHEIPAFTPRPRGRPRGSGRARASTGRPRGRPRGSRAQRGSGRGRGVAQRQHSPGRDDSGSDGDDSPAATPLAWDMEGAEEPTGGGKPFRRIKGEIYILENDELVTPNDPKGETKIDENGVLQGGRVFKATTFTIPSRPNPHRHYMLAIDAARSSGFRDSLYFFRRNPLMLKLTLTNVEKEFLIDNGNLSTHLRSRSVTMVTARSAYKLQGAKMIKDGRHVVDDYYEDQALADITARGLQPGDPVGDLGEPQGYGGGGPAGEAGLAGTYKAGQKPLVVKDPSGSIYKSGGPTTFFGGTGMGVFAADGEPAPGRARRPTAEVIKSWESLNSDWMHLTALAVHDVNDVYAKMRREALKAYQSNLEVDEVAKAAEAVTLTDGAVKREGEQQEKEAKRVRISEPALGVYEPHTGLVHYRADTQPSRARWEPVKDSTFRAVTGGSKAGSQAWGLARIDYVMETASAQENEKANVEARMAAVAAAQAAEPQQPQPVKHQSQPPSTPAPAA